jgi:uncharacterized protein (TIGR02246 family)
MAGATDDSRLADNLAIRDLLAQYADAVTRMSPEDLRDVFTDDAVWDVTGYGEHHGHDAIVAFLAGLLTHWQGIVHTVHHGRVSFDDADTAIATGWWVISEEGVLDGEGVRFTGVYHDRYTNAGGDGWRFSRRRYDGLLTTRASGTTVRAWPAGLR